MSNSGEAMRKRKKIELIFQNLFSDSELHIIFNRFVFEESLRLISVFNEFPPLKKNDGLQKSDDKYKQNVFLTAAMRYPAVL